MNHNFKDKAVIEEVLANKISDEALDLIYNDWKAFYTEPRKYKGTVVVNMILQYLEEENK